MSTQPNPSDGATGQATTPHCGQASPPPARWTSEVLLAGAREVQIEHQGSIYRLRLTQLGKLILTK